MCSFNYIKKSIKLIFKNYRYKSYQKAVDWSKMKKPIYLSKLGDNFAEWSATWAGYLITKVRE